jgi:hypothetical protein
LALLAGELFQPGSSARAYLPALNRDLSASVSEVDAQVMQTFVSI